MNNAEWQKSPRGKFAIYQRNARVRKVSFELTFEQFIDIVSDNCLYCGEEGYGVDRIDNSIGYTTDNSVPCCTVCNRMKSNLSFEQFVKQCQKVVENNP